MKHFEKGGVVVTYHKKAGFLPGEPEEFADEILKDRIESLEEEIGSIKKTLMKRKN